MLYSRHQQFQNSFKDNVKKRVSITKTETKAKYKSD